MSDQQQIHPEPTTIEKSKSCTLHEHQWGQTIIQNKPSIILSVVGFSKAFSRKITSSKMRQRVRHTEILKLINFTSKGIKKLKSRFRRQRGFLSPPWKTKESCLGATLFRYKNSIKNSREFFLSHHQPKPESDDNI